jgi:hypothetical protein
MARIRQSKPFAPKPMTPGSEITWTHYYPSGEKRERTGTVVGHAPKCGAGHKSEVWVVADRPLDSDLYHGGVVVAVATTGYVSRGGYSLDAIRVGKGKAFSDNYAGSPTGGLGVMNARRSWKMREVREAV